VTILPVTLLPPVTVRPPADIVDAAVEVKPGTVKYPRLVKLAILVIPFHK
jgi:hypothetical protein